jgi:hypothetical protein
MSVLEERIQAVRDKAGLSPADKRRRIETLKRAHKAKSSATSTPSGPGAEARQSAAENRRKDAESRKPKTFAGRMKARNKAAVTKEQLDAYKKAGGTGGLGGLLNKANKLGSVASAIKDTRERNVKRVAVKSSEKRAEKAAERDKRERQVKINAENAARKRSAALNREKDVKSRMKATETERKKKDAERKKKDAARQQQKDLLQSKTKTGEKGPSAADKAIYQSMKNKELGITIPSNLPSRKEKRARNVLNMYADTATAAVGLGGIKKASEMYKAVGGKTGLQKIVKQSTNPTDIPFLAQVANRTSGINRKFSNFIKNIAKEANKQTTTVKRRTTRKKNQAERDAETKARTEEITRANQRRAKDALETGYRHGGPARTRKVASAHKGPEGFKGTF